MCGPPGEKKAPESVLALLKGKGTGRDQATKFTRITAEIDRVVNGGIAGHVGLAGMGQSALADGPPGLPCQYRHNCGNETDLQDKRLIAEYLAKARKIGGSHRKTAFSLKENVGSIVRGSGVEKCVFFTPTLANLDGSPPDPDRAQSCWRKLEESIHDEFPGGGVRILERGGKTQRLHYHVLLNVGRDVRTGYDFSGSRAAQGASKRAKWHLHPSANPDLVNVERRLFTLSKKSGFGQIFHCEPVRSETEAIKTYLAKYICKHVGHRLLVDKGRRLVAYFGAATEQREVPSANAFSFGGSLVEKVKGELRPNYRNGWMWLWRAKTAQYMAKLGVDESRVKTEFGPKWAFLNREKILSEALPFYPYVWLAAMDGMLSQEEIEGHDVFAPARIECEPRERTTAEGHRRVMARQAAAAMGCTEIEAYATLFQRDILKNEITYQLNEYNKDTNHIGRRRALSPDSGGAGKSGGATAWSDISWKGDEGCSTSGGSVENPDGQTRLVPARGWGEVTTRTPNQLIKSQVVQQAGVWGEVSPS